MATKSCTSSILTCGIDDEGNESSRSLGLIVARGTLLVLISPVDGSEEIANPFQQQEEWKGTPYGYVFMLPNHLLRSESIRPLHTTSSWTCWCLEAHHPKIVGSYPKGFPRSKMTIVRRVDHASKVSRGPMVREEGTDTMCWKALGLLRCIQMMPNITMLDLTCQGITIPS